MRKKNRKISRRKVFGTRVPLEVRIYDASISTTLLQCIICLLRYDDTFKKKVQIIIITYRIVYRMVRLVPYEVRLFLVTGQTIAALQRAKYCNCSILNTEQHGQQIDQKSDPNNPECSYRSYHIIARK